MPPTALIVITRCTPVGTTALTVVREGKKSQTEESFFDTSQVIKEAEAIISEKKPKE